MSPEGLWKRRWPGPTPRCSDASRQIARRKGAGFTADISFVEFPLNYTVDAVKIGNVIFSFFF